MLNIVKFDYSLKITSIRILLNSDPDGKEFPPKYKFDRLVVTDSKYHNLIVSNIQKHF